MNTRSRKSIRWALALVALGMLALYGGPQTLAFLIPAAILVWYTNRRAQMTAIDSRGDNRTVGR